MQLEWTLVVFWEILLTIFLLGSALLQIQPPLEENMIPTAIETAAGSDHNRLANKGTNVIIPPFMAMPDFNKVRARTMGREIR